MIQIMPAFGSIKGDLGLRLHHPVPASTFTKSEHVVFPTPTD